MPARSIVLAALACFLPLLSAQTAKPASAPVATVTKPDLTGEAVVVEKSAIVLRYARDGSSVRTLTVVAHVLSDAGVRKTGIITFPFSSLTETLTFDFVRVRKASGEAIETPVEDAQEVPMPVTQAAPMYSDLRTKQLPVKSLSVGDTLEYQLTIQGTNADSPGAFWHPMSFSDGLPVKEETVELRVPRDLSVLVKSKKVQPVVSDDGDERVYRWKHETASEYPKKQDKDKAAQVELVQEMYDPDIAMTSFHSWAEVGAWYRGLTKDRAMPDAAIQAKADELTRGLTTDDAKVDALYHYVATQYRYIAVSFGIGRLQPHTAAEVFRNQYGDCKDKHTASGDAGGGEDRSGAGVDRLRSASERSAADALAVQPHDHTGEAEGPRGVAGFDARGGAEPDADERIAGQAGAGDSGGGRCEAGANGSHASLPIFHARDD
jgi:uncharacterized protein DUF3857